MEMNPSVSVLESYDRCGQSLLFPSCMLITTSTLVANNPLVVSNIFIWQIPWHWTLSLPLPSSLFLYIVGAVNVVSEDRSNWIY